MKYNNIFKISAMCLGAFALTACSDWLDPTTDSQLPESVAFNNVEDVQLAAKGLYADLCSDPYVQLQTIHQGAGTDCELIDGLGQTATNQNNERDGMNYNASTTWTKLGTLWEKQYKTIEDCNRIVEGISKSSIKDNDAVMIASAEARVIRAMVYLDLIRVFGDIPFRWDAAKSDLSNVNQGKTDRDVILDAIAADLEDVVAEGKLPWCGEKGITQEHINMGYAKGLLANIYMTRAGYAIRENEEHQEAIDGGYSSQSKRNKGYVPADYPKDENYGFLTLRPSDDECKVLYWKAAKQLKDIIDNPAHDMNETFAGFWDNINKLQLDPTNESMFEIPMGFGIAGELGYTVGVRMNGATTDWGFQNSAGKLKTTAEQLYSYAPCDTRRDITCIPYELKNIDRTDYATPIQNYTYEKDSVIAVEVKGEVKYYTVTDETVTIEGEEMPVATEYGSAVTAESLVKNKPFALYIGKWDIRKMSDRWKKQNLTASLKFGYGINTVKMRYPQILLWYAECLSYLTENGKPASSENFNPDEYMRGIDVEGDMNWDRAQFYVKKVHERAYEKAENSYTGRTPSQDLAEFDSELSGASNYKAMLDMIDLENRLEFCGECFRKWDLIRWNRLHDNIWKAKQAYIKGSTQDGDANALYQRKIYFKYKDEAVKEILQNGKLVKFYLAPEKEIDWSSATWYGTDGTNKEMGAVPKETWINEHGYRYASSKAYKEEDKKGYMYLGFGKDNKDFNAQSYAMNAFGYETYDSRTLDLSSICSGLVGNSITEEDQWDGNHVKNRYLMPIERNVQTSSNNILYNSYGY